jgi:ribosomal protein S18 acetylase RimI-like enzyme
MPPIQIEIHDDERPELDAFLEEQIYRFNADTTGIRDGTLLNASIADEQGRIVAGLTGHTWGGCCVITRLWVAKSMRGSGLGAGLMQAAEREAIRRGCQQIVLSTHSFQAPLFYEALGFRREAVIPNYPQGHEDIVYIKVLPGGLVLSEALGP